MDNKKDQHKDQKENETIKEDVENIVEEKEKDELVHLKNQISEFEDKYKRALADYQNLERRTEEQKREWIMQASKNVILKILPVLDTLMLAQKHIEDKGLTISIDQFLKALQDEGITRIKAVGEKFDPHLMESIGTMEGKEGQVLEEVRTGYRLYDTVLRSAQVIVGK
jgi:molecular chaperone GrpE